MEKWWNGVSKTERNNHNNNNIKKKEITELTLVNVESYESRQAFATSYLMFGLNLLIRMNVLDWFPEIFIVWFIECLAFRA